MISVVVPVYNVEKYLHYAMESLLKQTYKNFEIILVNDGSIDNSGKICEDYAGNYENIFVYHKENGGLSDARNFGVENSNGEFITFLDPDDYLECYSLELLAGIQKKYDCDIVSTRVKSTEVYNNYSNYRLTKKDYEKNIYLMDNKSFLEEALYDKVATVSACGKLYRRNILEVPFPKGKIYEDLFVISEHSANSKKIVHSKLQIYNYYKRSGSIVNSKFTNKQYDFFEAISNNRDVTKKMFNNEIQLINAINAKKVKGSFRIIESAFKSSGKDVYEIRKIIKNEYWNIILNKKIELLFKIKYTLFILSPRLFYKIKYMFKKVGE